MDYLPPNLGISKSTNSRIVAINNSQISLSSNLYSSPICSARSSSSSDSGTNFVERKKKWPEPRNCGKKALIHSLSLFSLFCSIAFTLIDSTTLVRGREREPTSRFNSFFASQPGPVQKFASSRQGKKCAKRESYIVFPHK